jgi:hypothetical protein
MKTLIRLLLAVVTTPLVLLVYALLWFALLVFGAEDNGMFYSNLPFIAGTWIVVITAFPLFLRAVNALDRGSKK